MGGIFVGYPGYPSTSMEIMSIHLDYDSDGCFQIGDISFALQHTPTLVIFLGYIWLYIFQMIPPLTVTTWWTPAAAHRLKVSCHAFAVLSQGVASQQRFGGAGRFGDNSRGGSHIIWLENPRHFFGAKTSVAMEKNQHTHTFLGENTHHVQCSIMILSHTHQIVILISKS